jgi:GrpB-like predicted nucleotidyltransferase (UPF0157 family)
LGCSVTNIIEIVPYDPAWPAQFKIVAAPMREALGDLALRIDHIGSTAVPGLAAKDRIDVQVTVRTLDTGAISTRLATLGYEHREAIIGDHVPPGADDDPEQWRKLYFRPPPGQRGTNLHVRQAGRANQRYALLFRDYLRADAGAAQAYRQVKEALARLHPDDIGAYLAVKDPVCDIIIRAAERWAAEAGYQQGPSDQ